MRGEFSFPDIKKLVMDHLAASLKDAGLYGESVPIYSNRPDDGAQVGQSWVRVVATGGQRSDKRPVGQECRSRWWPHYYNKN